MKHLSRVQKGIFLLSITCALLMGQATPGRASPSQEALPFYQGEQGNLMDQLHQLTGGKLRVSSHSKTGKVRFMGTDFSHAIPQPAILGDKPTPEAAARGFLSAYGLLFGLKDQGRELTVMRSKKADRGRSFIRFQQVYSGIPIVGGEIIVQVDSSNNVVSANGEILPDIRVDTSPRVSPAKAEERALGFVLKKYSRKYNLEKASLMVSTPELWIYNPILLGVNRDFTHLVWRMEVFPTEVFPIRELVLIDAHLGSVVLHFNQIDTVRYREVYDHNNTPGLPLPGPVVTRSEGGPPTGIPDVDNAYDYSGDTYDFYFNEHGRDSIDNAGMSLISTVRFCPNSDDCPFANAFWSGTQMVYGEGFASADDVVAHELTHGVTERESSLFYYMQSGAINEAFSDIWGEFVDLTNGRGDDSPGVRWLLGEDLPVGAIRSMANPPLYGDPDRMGSPNYVCGDWWDDGGGVHTNSGVANKATYLMTDGGSFNGYTVTGLGVSKVADLFYEVQTNLFTSASDHQDLYDGLLQAAINLGFSSSDRQEVKDAVDATEMNQQPSSCPAPEAPVCDSGVPLNLFFDDLENPGSGYWTHGIIVGVDHWYYPQIPNPIGIDTTYATSGQYNFWGYNQWDISDTYMAMTFNVSLPAGSAPYLHFRHSYEFEWGYEFYDGGVVEYSTDGGLNWFDAGSLFVDNGYTGTISSSWSNPLGGRQAFVAFSSGYISSRLDLSSLAGQNVRFRFRMGTDDGWDAIGWFIDDIRIYVCGTGRIVSDFDGDGETDNAVFRRATGVWWINPSGPGTPYSVGFGGHSSDIAVAEDYEGDGQADIAIYRAATGVWWVRPSSTGTPYAVGFGGHSSDIPTPGDYDGDGEADIAVFRAASGVWWVRPSSTGTPYAVGFGGHSSDIPTPGDYDGDGEADIAIYRAASGVWWVRPSSTGAPYAVGWGGHASDMPVPGDYDGDGEADIAIYRAASGVWWVRPSSTGAPYAVGWGGHASDMPVPGDYDGDGEADIAIYRSATGVWWIRPSSTGAPYAVGWGGHPSDMPVNPAVIHLY